MVGAAVTTAVAVLIGLSVPIDRMRSPAPPLRSTVQPPPRTVQPFKTSFPLKQLGGSCAICLLHGSVDDTRQCGHSFHAACIAPWVQQGLKSYCPICRLVSQPTPVITAADAAPAVIVAPAAPAVIVAAAPAAPVVIVAPAAAAPAAAAPAVIVAAAPAAADAPAVIVAAAPDAPPVTGGQGAGVRGGGEKYDKFIFM